MHGAAPPGGASSELGPAGPGALLCVLRDAETSKHLNKTILREASDPHRLLQLVEEHGGRLQALNVCTLLHRLAKRLAKEGVARMIEKTREMQQTPQWRALLDLVYRYAPDCNNMELTNCLWAIATLDARGAAEEEVVLQLLRYCLSYIDTFEPRNLALSAWALAKMGYRDPEWCRIWASHVLRRLREFDTRDMTMMVWAFATVHWRDESFLARFCEEVERKCEEGGPQDIGNTLWALATLSFRHEAALAALSAQCFKKAEAFDQQNLSIILWSYATIGYKNMNLLHYLTQLVTERIKEFASQGIANTVWACAKFQFQQKCLLMTVAEEAIPRLDDFEPQHLAIVAWAYATLEFPNRPLLTALCQAATRKMHIFSAQHMANMTWAMATLAHKDEEYLRRLALRALEQVEQFNPQECSNLAWAFALLTFRDDTLLAALSRRSQEIVMDFIPQNLGNTAWAYNRLGFRDEELMKTMVQQAALRLDECQGQEVLDVIESIETGGYAEAVDQTYWRTLMAWSGRKFEGARDFLDSNSRLPLTLPALSEFDRALAVQDYRDQLAAFDILGLGYTYTARLLLHLGVRLPEGRELDEWRAIAQEAAVEARHEGDQGKNLEAQEGLKACRTVCIYRYAIAADSAAAAAAAGDPQPRVQGPTPVVSGPATDAHELGLFAATLKHPRGGDGEFQALQACARVCHELGCRPEAGCEGGGASAVGEVWLHVSEVPCLSCVGAMAQFRRLFPRIALNVAFTLGRQAGGGVCIGAEKVDGQRPAAGPCKTRTSAPAAAALKMPLAGVGSHADPPSGQHQANRGPARNFAEEGRLFSRGGAAERRSELASGNGCNGSTHTPYHARPNLDGVSPGCEAVNVAHSGNGIQSCNGSRLHVKLGAGDSLVSQDQPTQLVGSTFSDTQRGAGLGDHHFKGASWEHNGFSRSEDDDSVLRAPDPLQAAQQQPIPRQQQSFY